MNRPTETLPPIPKKLYFSIGETSTLCAVKPHVLRYWEQEFSQIKPTKRRGGRRYYQIKDVELIRFIRELLYIRGFTIIGAKQQLSSGGGVEEIAEEPLPTKQEAAAPAHLLSALLSELRALRDLLAGSGH